jgi:hypothetical protein
MSVPKIPKSRVKQILQNLIDAIPDLRKHHVASEPFIKWKSATEVGLFSSRGVRGSSSVKELRSSMPFKR